MINIKLYHVTELATNCCYLVDETTGKSAVTDPGAESKALVSQIEKDGGRLEYVILTHGHYDHTTGAPELHEALPKAKVYIHRNDANGAGSRLFPLASQIHDLNFDGEGDKLPLGELTIHVMHTPGHSTGSVVLQVEDVLFCGDTLFAGSCGRTDFPGGSMKKIMTSLARLANLEGDLQVLPGHMEPSTMERERRQNPYVLQALSGK